MALETVVFQHDPFVCGCKDFCNTGGGFTAVPWSYGLGFEDENLDTWGFGLHANFHSSPCSMGPSVKEQWDINVSSSPGNCTGERFLAGGFYAMEEPTAKLGRGKRRRTKNIKNREEVENQRMTHIAVERNRRRQMNDYLAVLRSLMPASYVQRGDQASIIGGAINFVKELEQLLQSLEAHRQLKQRPDTAFASLFSDVFSFPQYSTLSSSTLGNNSAERPAGIADVEVTMVETHANLKILSRRRPKQLLKIAAGLQSLSLTILHLNVTTVDCMVLYSFSVKVEDDCQLTSVNEIAAAVYEMMGKIQAEATPSSG